MKILVVRVHILPRDHYDNRSFKSFIAGELVYVMIRPVNNVRRGNVHPMIIGVLLVQLEVHLSCGLGTSAHVQVSPEGSYHWYVNDAVVAPAQWEVLRSVAYVRSVESHKAIDVNLKIWETNTRLYH